MTSLRPMEKCIDRIERISNKCAGWLVVFLMGLVVSDVSYRFVIKKSIAGAYSLSEIIMVGICFLAMAYTQKEKGHVAVDFVLLRLKGKSRQWLEVISSVLSLIISVLLFYRSFVEAQLAVKIRLVTSGIVNWPAWPLKIVVALGFFFLSVRIAIQLRERVSSLRSGPENHAV